MSSSNAAAIRRRAGTQQTDTAQQSSKNTAQPSSKNTAQISNQMTLQQVISTVDKRLQQLEQLASNNELNDNNTNDNDISNIVNEFNNRFELIVTEINSLKDIVLKLQTFTMDVNKRLLDERIEVLSEVEPNSTLHIEPDVIQQNNSTLNFKELVQQELND
jgi:hypothetical protein